MPESGLQLRIPFVAIPAFRADGLLPEGIHEATWTEFSERFGYNETRHRVLRGLRTALWMLADAGCEAIYVDGSFVSAKAEPADWDGCWDTSLVALDRVNDMLLDTSPAGIYNQKQWLLGELYPVSAMATPTVEFLEFFQRSRDDGLRKGIVKLDPRDAV